MKNSRLIESKVIKTFFLNNNPDLEAEVILSRKLDDTNDVWTLHARYSGGGLVNGFGVVLDAVTNHSIDDVSDTEAIKEMVNKLIDLSNTELWDSFTS